MHYSSSSLRSARVSKHKHLSRLYDSPHSHFLLCTVLLHAVLAIERHRMASIESIES